MPHKRNPELGERVSGLARLIRGHSVTALENQALWHERDISHSSNERIILPDSCLALDYILQSIYLCSERTAGLPQQNEEEPGDDQRTGFLSESHAGFNR